MQLLAKWALQSRRVCLSTLESDALLTCRVPTTFQREGCHEPCESLSGSSRSGVLCWDRRARAGVATEHEGSALPNTMQSSGEKGAEQIQ